MIATIPARMTARHRARGRVATEPRAACRAGMGASIDAGGGDKRSVDVAINIVPFIDIMSCLTAFLLVTAAWLNIARVDATTARGKNCDACIDPPDLPKLSVMITDDTIYVGATRLPDQDVTRTIDRRSADAFGELRTTLAQLKHDYFAEQADIQIAAESRDDHVVHYQDLVAAMDGAIQAGFSDVQLTDASGLAWRPRL
jgi:biopolymer transport protein ExbD